VLARKLLQHTKAKVMKVKTTAPDGQRTSRAWLNVLTSNTEKSRALTDERLRAGINPDLPPFRVGPARRLWF